MINRMAALLCSTSLAVLLACATLLQPATASAQAVAVRHPQGTLHGFLVLRTLKGDTLADGDVIQIARGNRVTTQLVFHFKDGSIHDETAVFSQGSTFRFLSDHLIQKGPSFPHPMDVLINGSTGQVTVHSTDDKGKPQVNTARLTLPPDVSNGGLLTLLMNLPPGSPERKLSMVAATPKPRLIKLAVSSTGEDTFSVGGSSRKATHYVLKVEIGGAKGVVAPMVGKQPPDTHVWILPGDAPAFVKLEGALAYETPVWRIELASPVWP
jgi:hypothetical protein